jgi:hypothetical protein
MLDPRPPLRSKFISRLALSRLSDSFSGMRGNVLDLLRFEAIPFAATGNVTLVSEPEGGLAAGVV